MNTIYQPVCRSFVRRARPLTDRQQQLYRQLAANYLIPFTAELQQPLDLTAHFKRQPLILEIGFGSGEATWQIAQRNPSYNYLAVDIYPPGILKLMRNCFEENIANVKIIEGDAIPLLNWGLKTASLSAVHLFFPDPWPKKRHHRRRFLQTGSMNLLATKIIDGGYLYFVSDWHDYAQQVEEQVERHPQWRLDYRQHKPWRPETSFESKASAQGRDIFELLLTRCA